MVPTPVQRSGLKFVLLEDADADAELILDVLERGGLRFTHVRVVDEAGFRSALHATVDLILADFILPDFDALHALRILREEKLSIPVIVVTGHLSEARAKEFVIFGAEAYISKDHLNELPAVIQRVLDMPIADRD